MAKENGSDKKEIEDEVDVVEHEGWEHELEGDLETWPVTIKNVRDPKNPDKRKTLKCELREFDGFTRDKYLNKESKDAQDAPKTKVGPKMREFAKQRGIANVPDEIPSDHTDFQAKFIHEVLWDLDTQEPVPIPWIRNFPSKTQIKLYKWALEINGFGKLAEQLSKNA